MKRFIKCNIMLISVVAITTFHSYSQINKIGYMLSGGVQDAEYMLTEYIRPLCNSLGANLNGGWYNTADVHKLGGFHLNFTASVAFVPEDHQTYDLANPKRSNFIRFDDNIAKTAAGAKGAGPEVWYVMDVPVIGEQEIVRFDHPGGTGLSMIPSPMINAGLGLIKGTEIMGRYMPKLKFGGEKANSFDLWGIGIKHDLKQWIPFIKKVPVLQTSIMYGYTRLNFHTDLKPITPSLLGVDPANDLTTTADWETQNMDVQIQGHTANLLFGINLPVVCFYGGAGFSITKTNLSLNGDFPVPTIETNMADPRFGEVVVTDASVETDPFDIEIKNKSGGGTTKPRLNVGMRFKFTVITLHVDYTYANYSVATAGLGISFR